MLFKAFFSDFVFDGPTSVSFEILCVPCFWPFLLDLFSSNSITFCGKQKKMFFFSFLCSFFVLFSRYPWAMYIPSFVPFTHRCA